MISEGSPPDDLEWLIRSPPSRKALQAPNWLNKINKERAEEFLIDRILDNLLSNIPDGVVQVTAESHLTVEKIGQREECKEAIKNRKSEFTFQIQDRNLPAFHPWVEFIPKLAGIGVGKLRFDYLAQPEIAAKDVKVTLMNGHLSDVSIDSLDASIEMSMLVHGVDNAPVPVKLGTIHWKLNLYQKLNQNAESSKSAATGGEKKFCTKCGKSIRASSNFCTNCGANQAQRVSYR